MWRPTPLSFYFLRRRSAIGYMGTTTREPGQQSIRPAGSEARAIFFKIQRSDCCAKAVSFLFLLSVPSLSCEHVENSSCIYLVQSALLSTTKNPYLVNSVL